MRIASLVLLAVTVLAIAPAPARAGEPELRAVLQQMIDQYLARRAKPEHISAVSLSLSLPGASDDITLATGKTSIGGSQPVTPDNLFEIGSITKSFTSATLLQLEAEGKLNVDQSVAFWLPQYPAWNGVTMRRLLDMTSGIPGYDNQPAMLIAEAKTIHRRWTPPQLAAFADPVYPGHPKATTGYDYSNTNYILAGMIVERVTGQSLQSEFERRFISQFNLNDTYYRPAVYPQAVLDRLVSGYFYNFDPDNKLLAPLIGQDLRTGDQSWAGAAGGIVAKPDDVTHWVRALFGGKVVAPKQQREMETTVSLASGKPIVNLTAADSRAFGLGIAKAYRKGMGSFWFYEGETLGYRCAYVWLPNSDTVYTVAVNSQTSGAEDGLGALLQRIYTTLRARGTIRSNGT